MRHGEYGSAYEITKVQRGEEIDIVWMWMPVRGTKYRLEFKANDSVNVVGIYEITSGRKKLIKQRVQRDHIMEIAQQHLRTNPRLEDDA